jgi:N-methylhydantoinase B
MNINPVDASIIGQALMAIAREMGRKLVSAAFSTIIREARDTSTAILTADGQMIAQAEMIPIQLGSMSATLKPCLEKFPLDSIGEDDFFINNHPYRGGQHLQDVFIFLPVFVDGELIAFCGSTAHHLDLGGQRGINRIRLDYFQEGFVIPPMKLSMSRDWRGAFYDLLTANIRAPDLTIGDFDAQFAANRIGVRRLQELAAKHGTATLKAAMAHFVDYSEALMRAAVRGVPNGRYVGEDRLDHCGIDGRPITARVVVAVEHESLTLDFAGSSQQVDTNINAPIASSTAAALSCLKALLLPLDVPFNEGTARVVDCRFPLGSFVNPRPPAAVGARMEACYRVYCAVMKAMAKAVPDMAVSSGFDASVVTRFAHRSDTRLQVAHEVHGGGFGASRASDGADGVAASLSNVTNTPVEAADMEFDHIRIVAYELIANSGGDGEFRGGLGLRRVYEVLQDDVEFSFFGDRLVVKPDGLKNGAPGTNARCTLQRKGQSEPFDPQQITILRRGDIVTIETSGGAGYGESKRRSADLRKRDLAQGFVT